MSRLKFINIHIMAVLSLLMLTACTSNTNKNTVGETSEIVTTSVITSESFSNEAVSEFSDTNANVTINTSESEAVTDTEYGEYTYSPPDAALDVEFVRDNIIHKIEYSYYRNNGTAELPEFILSDMNSYANEFISNSEYDYSLEWIGVDMFDINSDGFKDYIVVGQIMDMLFVSKQEGDAPYIPIERIYVPNENGGFDVIAFPASCGKGTVNNDHILSTKTNGYNDFLGSSDDGIILVNFDGNSTYFKAEVLSEDYTWEYLDNDLVKIICYDNRNKNEIAVAKFLYDNGYTEHILLYSSLPDGTPSVSVPQTYGSSKLFEFYVKRTDKAPERWNDWAAGPIEINFIPADYSKSF